MNPERPVLVFDLDGTLIDSVYQHVITWSAALQQLGVNLSVWRIHRRIGMSGGLIAHALLREAGRDLDDEVLRQLRDTHTALYLASAEAIRPLPGARQLLEHLTKAGVPWAIASSGRRSTVQPMLNLLGVDEDTPVVTHDEVTHAKPDPDLFLEAARRLGSTAENLIIVGDSVWDLLAARRAQALGIGLLSGGYGREELETAGAYRVYDDPADLLDHIDEIGIRT
ncbi:MAG TPA: HAD family hydrolase [Dehalococcoidia bacterium]|nr:HAD family hydrolase [Dehalococcoidia bacterium]